MSNHPLHITAPWVVDDRRVLVVDDEPAVRAALEQWLTEAGWTPVCVASPHEAFRAARRERFRVAVVDYRLEAGDNGIRLGRALFQRYGLPFLLISGYLNTSVVVQAVKAGAVDVIDKPLTSSRLVVLIERAMSGGRTLLRLDTNERSTQPGETDKHDSAAAVAMKPAASRWAWMVLAACEIEDDPRTVALWGRAIGVSAGTIEETCRLCHVSAHDSKDLARLLRAISLNRVRPAGEWPGLCNFLSVADERTLRRLFQRAGLDLNIRYVSLKTFFTRQRFIPTSAACLRELAHLAANSPLFF